MSDYVLSIVSCDVRVRPRLKTLTGRGARARVAALVMYFVSRLLLSLSRRGAVTCNSQQTMKFTLHTQHMKLTTHGGT